MTIKEIFTEILKKADRNLVFESDSSDYFITICKNNETEDLIEAAISYMSGDKKEIFEHMFQSSKIALEQINKKSTDVNKKKKD